MSADLFDAPVAPPRFDRYGRYLMPDPITGEEKGWTRVTTFAKTIADTYHLEAWKRRMVTRGMGLRPDLQELAATTGDEDKPALNSIAEQAMEAAGASVGRNHGTAMHTLTEQLDRQETITYPEHMAPDLAAYFLALATAGLIVLPEYIERRVLITRFALVGTLDRILCDADGQLRVGDLKTAQDVDYARLEIAVQLACYARADFIWNTETQTWEPMPRGVDVGDPIVMHLPAGVGRCDLYEVDLESGWAAAELCSQVRSSRTSRHYLAPYIR